MSAARSGVRALSMSSHASAPIFTCPTSPQNSVWPMFQLGITSTSSSRQTVERQVASANWVERTLPGDSLAGPLQGPRPELRTRPGLAVDLALDHARYRGAVLADSGMRLVVEPDGSRVTRPVVDRMLLVARPDQEVRDVLVAAHRFVAIEQ